MIEIVNGLFDRMVMQRTKQDVSDADISGKCSTSGTVEAKVTKKGKTVKGFAWVAIGTAARKQFTATLKGLPVGGPYDIRLRIKPKDTAATEMLEIKDVLVGDVWILAGQSNMEGLGRLPGPKPINEVRCFYMDDRWAPAEDKIHELWKAVDQVHHGYGACDRGVVGVGPGVPFGQEMFRLTGVPQGVISCAHGGTSMQQWSPTLKRLKGKSLYGATIRRFLKNGGKVAGVMWYQGCSDTGPADAPHYTTRMKKLVAAFRRDMHDEKLPFVLVQIALIYSNQAPAAWNSIQDQQRKLPEVIDNCLTVPAIDLSLDDCIHISTEGQIRLGARLADATCALTKRAAGHKKPITLKKVTIKQDKKFGTYVEVAFANVAGRLVSGSRPTGFSLADWAGQYQLQIYRVDLKGSRVILWTDGLSAEAARSYWLHYGLGTSPYCNITDEADRSLPVFGPLPLGIPRAMLPFLTKMRTSKLLPSAGKLHKLSCPDTSDPKLSLVTRDFGGPFCQRHEELEAHGEDALIYFAFKFSCEEAMKLKFHVGYDGPVKIWCDGKKMLHDPNGTNPALADAASFDVAACEGTHEMVIAMASNEGKAWGIFMRASRADIPRKCLSLGPTSVSLPEFMA